MPYVRHDNGYDEAHANHSSGTLGGFDNLVRCRGHYPDPNPCDSQLFAEVPPEDVCPNCHVITEAEYEEAHSERIVHMYEHQFIPHKRAQLAKAKALKHPQRLIDQAQAQLDDDIAEHAQAKRDHAKKGDSVRKRRERDGVIRTHTERLQA